MGRDVVQVQGHVARAPDDVWSVVRDFCGKWHPWIATMREETGPKGARVRVFTVKGEDTLYREQQTYLSDSDRVLGYTHLEGIKDCEAYDARVTVTAAEDGGSHVGWTATVRAPAGRLNAICEGTKAVFNAGIEALGQVQSATSTKSPGLPSRCVVDTLIFDDLPRLALTVSVAPPPQPSPTGGREAPLLSVLALLHPCRPPPPPRGEGMGVAGTRPATGCACSCTGSAGRGRTGWSN